MNMHGSRVVAPLTAVLMLSGVSGVASAALSCPFADGNGAWMGACLAHQGIWRHSLLARDWAGNGVGVDAYYDPILNLTWLADADFAQTSGHAAHGLMNWSAANAWAGGLTLFGGTDWRLPTVTPVDGTANFNTAFSTNGSTDWGTARTDQGWGGHSEMGFMYYVHLGNRGFWLPDGTFVQSGWGLQNTGPFRNLIPEWYWSDRPIGSSGAWGFSFNDGFQNGAGQGSSDRAWAVHPGDLLIPLPGALWLMGSALVGVVAGARRRR